MMRGASLRQGAFLAIDEHAVRTAEQNLRRAFDMYT